MNSVEITYFSDILCIWAYASQARINAVKGRFAEAVRVENRFVSVFGDTATKISRPGTTKADTRGSTHTCSKWQRGFLISRFTRISG